jgi:hypothetical protein
VSQTKGVGETVGRNHGLSNCQVRNFAELLVKGVQARKDVAEDVDVTRVRYQRGIEVGNVLSQWKAERLVSGQRLRSWRGWSVLKPAQHEDEQQGDQRYGNSCARREVVAKP